MTKTACALGFFDGVHKAHSQILSSCAAYAQEHNLTSAAVTFVRSPSEFFGADTQYITTFTQKQELILSLGIEHVFPIPCDAATLSLSPEEFVFQFLVEKLNAEALFCGFNYTFGKNAAGNVATLSALCEKYNIKLFVSDCMEHNSIPVSSTSVRRALNEGNIPLANELLSRPFEIRGTIAHGKRLGSSLGFPTANIYPPEGLVHLLYGVYATKCLIDDTLYPAVTNVGVNPTVNSDGKIRVENHIIDFDRDVYLHTLSVRFYKYMRGEQRFPSVDALRAQIERDKAATIAYFKKGAGTL
ncbi:MAG: riboflavin biosynthesis protein RibF [Clostridia bacterium]|nr:riboflavin biosynthesis protein RibF [Clostridia bacterium]